MDSPLVGICLVGEVESNTSNVIGIVYMPQSNRSKSLTEFRQEVNSALPQTLSQKHYIFLTTSGWEINETLESTVKVSDVVTDEGTVKVRINYQRPRVGIVIEGNPDFAVGFVFCNIQATVEKFWSDVKEQLPSLVQSLSTTSFCFLDRNGWPIAREQEHLMTMLDISMNYVVRIRCFKPEKRLPQQLCLTESVPELLLPRLTVASPAPMSVSVSSPLVATVDPNHSLVPITEKVEQVEAASVERSIGSEVFTDSLKQSFVSGTYVYEILISYVHKEAADYAPLLKDALEKFGYSVFLDVDCIQGGTDWQDALNDAITNCSLFIPLITMQYGNTLWTNREVKMADVLGKIIIPVNSLHSWPPKCLAIQFATTQFIPCTLPAIVEGSEMDKEQIASIATDISQRYQQEMVNDSEEVRSLQASQLSVMIEESESSPSSVSPPPMYRMKKKSSVKSYASSLPESLPATYRKSIQESREGSPLVVFCCHSSQRDFTQRLVGELKHKDYEVWCTNELNDITSDDERQREIFQVKADEAGAIVFVLSTDFSNCAFCEEQVYYCEQRKRIIPLLYEPLQLPHWMAMLIGTNTFVDCRSSNYMTTFLERIESALNPAKVKQDLKEILRRKAQIARMCTDLRNKLPKGKLVYISGGTRFFSPSGEEICKELGKQLAQDLEVVLVTGGFYGVGETTARSFYNERIRMRRPSGVCHVVAVRDDQDKSHQTRQNPDGTFQVVPYGETLFYGDSVRQREMLTPIVLDLCVLIEGGPGAAFEAQQFVWNGNCVIPVKVTGGAAGGSFNVPKTIVNKPPNVAESDWTMLGDSNASPVNIAASVCRIVTAIKCSTVNLQTAKRGVIKRSETLPADYSIEDPSMHPMKRTFSDSSSPIPSISRRKAIYKSVS